MAAKTVMSKGKFHSKWEALKLGEEVVAEGTWFYQDEIPHGVQLIKSKWNYKSKDLVVLGEILEIPYCDYIDFNISDEGYLCTIGALKMAVQLQLVLHSRPTFRQEIILIVMALSMISTGSNTVKKYITGPRVLLYNC